MMSSGGVVLMLLDHVEMLLHQAWPNFSSIRRPECPSQSFETHHSFDALKSSSLEGA